MRDVGLPHGHLHYMIKRCYSNNLGRRKGNGVVVIVVGKRW